MRYLPLAAALGLLAIPALPASQASAQSWYGHPGYYRGDGRDVRRAQRECRRDLRRADTRREYYRELRDCRRDLARARRDWRDDGRWYGRSAYRQSNGRYYWDGWSWRSRW